ncbi:MAG: class I SAM-dependent methyltransferase [Synergistaceae bacterium]|nr:class I SAM-dependent methyltransferase [Synergistaceae bacterium]
MLQWSVYFQNPEFLERSRLELVVPDYAPLIYKWCGVKDDSKILDVACGSGFFSRFLKHAGPNVSVTGFDLDENFISSAKVFAERENLDIDFVMGDARSLPFDDASFDVVASHTFFTSAPEPEKVLAEMKRVLRPGGRVASITGMSVNWPETMRYGNYPPGCFVAWAKDFFVLSAKLEAAYDKINPRSEYVSELKPSAIPNFFATHGLKNVCAYPLGKVFSFSNAATPIEIKKRWLELYETSELKKLETFMKLQEMKEFFTEEDAERFRELLRMKCEYYRANPNENEIWEMNGYTNILVTGDI